MIREIEVGLIVCIILVGIAIFGSGAYYYFNNSSEQDKLSASNENSLINNDISEESQETGTAPPAEDSSETLQTQTSENNSIQNKTEPLTQDNNISLDSGSQTSCASENQQYSGTNTNYPSSCCSALAGTKETEGSISIADVCYTTSQTAISSIGYCINCGDGVCGEKENPCNCLSDCTGKGKSTFSTLEDFCSQESGYNSYCADTVENPLILCQTACQG